MSGMAQNKSHWAPTSLAMTLMALTLLPLQFSDPSTASECLFSLVNGDDMFNTYVEMSKVSFPAWIFSKIYLYVFISLFIYVVLSVFIGLIADTYETIRVSCMYPHPSLSSSLPITPSLSILPLSPLPPPP